MDSRTTTSGSTPACTPFLWLGEVTWRQVAELRDALFDEMDARALGVCLDVRRVTEIDRTGIALLIGANHRARSMGKPLTLVDDAGVVTEALMRAKLMSEFQLVGHGSNGVVGAPTEPALVAAGAWHSVARR
jgi:anti-anti-sigma regulatory factor